MTRHHTLLALGAGLLAGGTALAQSTDRPWHVGLKQDFTHQSNVLGTSSGEVGDTISTTSLFGGLNLPFGRQRAFVNASLNHERYADLSARNNNGYALAAGLDWSTIERLSGNVLLNANRRQADINSGGLFPVVVSNIERSDELSTKLRLGVVTMLAFEGSLGHRRVSFSAPEFASRAYRNDSASLGLSYRPSAILSLGTGLSTERTRYRVAAPGQTAPDRSDRQDVYATATWVPTGASTVSARIAGGKTEYERATSADFDGVTGYLTWAWKPTGLLDITTTLSRDSGQESGFLRLGSPSSPSSLGLVSASDFSQVTNALSVRAAYELTGKIMLNAGLHHARRNLIDGFTGVGGSDRTTTASLGARWAATRTLAFGCNASRETRSALGGVSSEYDSDRIGCFGQITLD